MIKYLIIAFWLILFGRPNLYAKSDFEIKGGSIESVSFSDAKLILIVSGDCDFLVAKRADIHGNVESVKSLLNHGIITIFRSGEIYSENKSWDALCKKAQDIAIKKEPVLIQCILSQLTIFEGEITFVSCKEVSLELFKK